MLDCVHHHEEVQTLQQQIPTINLSLYEDEALPLIDGLRDLPFDETEENYYMGGVGGGLGLPCVWELGRMVTFMSIPNLSENVVLCGTECLLDMSTTCT